VDQCEKRWSFTPALNWREGTYRIRAKSYLEDVCGNAIAHAFERPLRKGLHEGEDPGAFSLIFRLV
jgi:hypothetical protein